MKQAVLPALLLAVDRLTKIWAKTWLMPRLYLPILPFLHLTYVENTGAAFGIGAHRNGFFTAFSLALLGFLVHLHFKWREKSAWLRYGLLLVAVGAVGNLYDRLAYGYVVDFIDLRVWPVFNVADSCVTIGASCLAWGLHKDEAGEKTTPPA